MHMFLRVSIQMTKNKLFDKLGPGLITGAADDDPSGIATYSQGGAQFGYNMLWTLWLTWPLMIVIQLISARIGAVTGHGLTENIRLHYTKPFLYGIVGLLCVANTLNIAADLVAMGDAFQLLMDGPRRIYVAIFGVISLILQVFIPYHKYVRFLKWLTLSLFAYVGVVFVIHIPWQEVIVRTFLPHISFQIDFIMTVVAIFGTTISPYLFFWQASQEVEEMINNKRKALKDAPEQAYVQLNRIKVDTYIGMTFSNIIAAFIILTTASVLHYHNVTDIQTSTQAAQALKPLAGNFAFLLFALGIIGTGLLAIPVLAGSIGYAVAEAFKLHEGMELKPALAKGFYSAIVIATLIGVGVGFTSINPIKALYWSAVINGVVAIPIMAIMVLIASQNEIMGNMVIEKHLQLIAWGTVFIMAIATIIMVTDIFI